MRPSLRTLLCLLASFAPASCFGTMYTRTAEDAQFFGWPLFEAFAADVHVVAGGQASEGDPWLSAFVGMPVDLVLDLVLLPADVVMGIAGDEKRTVSSFKKAMEQPRGARRDQPRR